MERDNTTKIKDVVRAPTAKEALHPYDEDMQRDILRGEDEGLGVIYSPEVDQEVTLTPSIPTQESK